MPYTGQTIAELDETKPSGTTEYVNTGDDAIKEIKSVLKKQYAVTTKTAAYTTTVSDSTILCDATAAAFTVTVVSAVTAGAGKRQKFKKTDASANAVTISYGSSTVLTRQNDVLELISDGTNWVVISVVNADKVDGYDASPTPGANTIPVSGSDGYINPQFLGGNTPDATKFLRGDKTWQTISTATVEITATTQAVVSNTRYVANNTAQVVFTLPAAPSLGDFCIVEGKGTGGWKITPASGQEIQLKGYKTALSIQSGHYMDCITLVHANNNLWVAEVLTDLGYATIKATGGKGYIMGGYAGAATAVIEDLIFSNETSQAITATLDTAKYDGAGVQYGYL